jgi:4-hydroxybenzoate polyprenyltransferase
LAANEPGSSVLLERDLILSDLSFELFLLVLREAPIQALRMLMGNHAAVEALPFHPRALRYDMAKVEALRRQAATGAMPAIASNLPEGWRNAILEHLGLMPNTVPVGPEAVIEPAAGPTGIMAYVKALRLHQWSKNMLVFVPIAMAHQLTQTAVLANTLLAFVCFGLVASSIYLMNDMMDLHQDRRHPVKRLRPFASGAVPVAHGLVMIPLLLGAAALIASELPRLFSMAMLAYFTLNLGYTFYLKRKLLVDVLALSGAYTLRILAGNAAGPIEISNWLLAFAMFLFLSLALVKRYIELDTVGQDQADAKRVMGRGYRKADLDMIAQLGVASGFSAVLVLALFVEGAGKSGLYQHRALIWLVCPIVLYVIGRIWVLAKRRELPDDPIMFIIKDWRSHLMGAAVAGIFYLAI